MRLSASFVALVATCGLSTIGTAVAGDCCRPEPVKCCQINLAPVVCRRPPPCALRAPIVKAPVPCKVQHPCCAPASCCHAQPASCAPQPASCAAPVMPAGGCESVPTCCQPKPSCCTQLRSTMNTPSLVMKAMTEEFEVDLLKDTAADQS